MRTRLLLLSTLLAFAAPFGCADPPSPATRPAVVPPALAEREAAVLEAALREWLQSAEPGGTVFISLGPMRGGWTDPPPGFLERFGDLPLTLKPVSKARLPEENEMESPDRFRGVENPATGERAKIYWAGVKKWVSDTKVRVETGVYSGPLGGGGNTSVLELRDGVWTLADTVDFWVS